MSKRAALRASCDVVVVGAGFAGLYLHHLLRQSGLSVVGFDVAGDVGGTWWWNRYPGARCDIESWDYSYSFSAELQQDWTWSERYAAQPEILRYLNHVADRFDLRRDIRFGTRVESASWSDAEAAWTVTTDHGDVVTAQFCIMALGCLSELKTPDIAGVASYAGEVLHTARWPEDAPPLAGKRVGVIGTGSSGIQVIPMLAREAGHVTVFQRTPSYALPARNRALEPAETAEFKQRYPQHREAARVSFGGVVNPRPTESALAVSAEERAATFARAWESGTLFGLAGSYNDLMLDEAANRTVVEFVHGRIRQLVDDPERAASLSPTTFPFGARRNCLDTGYYETYNRPNVSLVDLRQQPIVEVVPAGVRTTERVHELDVLVFATGFDAMTGPLLAFEIVGSGGQTLREAWRDGPATYLGAAIAGFPNLFTLTGPGSPSVLTNMVASIEQHAEFVVELIGHVRAQGRRAVQAEPAAQAEWTQHVADVADFTLYTKADSWYRGTNVPGKQPVFLPYVAGLGTFRQRCDDVAADGYRGFRLT